MLSKLIISRARSDGWVKTFRTYGLQAVKDEMAHPVPQPGGKEFLWLLMPVEIVMWS